MRSPLDPFSKVLDEQSHWDPEWYSWLQELVSVVNTLQTVTQTAFDPWVPWTPLVTTDTGAAITVNQGGSRYIKIGKTVIAQFDFQVASVAAGANYILFRVPVVPIITGGVFFRERAVIGYTGSGFIANSTQFFLVKYDNAATALVNHLPSGMAIYETSA